MAHVTVHRQTTPTGASGALDQLESRLFVLSTTLNCGDVRKCSHHDYRLVDIVGNRRDVVDVRFGPNHGRGE